MQPINVTAVESMAIWQEQDVVPLIWRVRQLAAQLGMNVLNQTKIITATSELSRNMLNHASGGDVKIELVSRGQQSGIRLTFSDKGPGIADIDLAMQRGYSSGSGLGLGLSGAKQLVNEFSIDSTIGAGTTVTIIKWMSRH